MNIIERGKAFAQWLRILAQMTVWDWMRCPHCGSEETTKWGFYVRRPWFLSGRQEVKIQRHRCKECGQTYSERSPWLKRGSWYAREVHRCAIDSWQHGGMSLRRTAEMMRSMLGKQERYLLWRPLEEAPKAEMRCHLSASTVHRWLDKAGATAEESVNGQLAGIVQTVAVGADGLWARVSGGGKRVVLLLTDSVTGLVFPPLVASGEESAKAWQRLFARAETAGLDIRQLRGVTSDGAKGLVAYLREGLVWTQHQRCVWHLWRNLRRPLAQAAQAASEGMEENAAKQRRKEVRKELGQLIRNVINAPNYPAAEEALERVRLHAFGTQIAHLLNLNLDRILVYSLDYYQGLMRVNPEWCWRDFRLRLSRGRNHGSERRLERATLLWAVYRNFTPAQERSERKRHYRHPGLSPLAVAGFPHPNISYLDALNV
jgi:transposase-like protein